MMVPVYHCMHYFELLQVGSEMQQPLAHHTYFSTVCFFSHPYTSGL